ncbi:MAG: hemolysin III family protein, partial [Curvibacter sp.]
MTERPQTLGEEIANSLSHGVALLAALAGLPLLLASVSHLQVANIVGAAVFGATMI